MNERNVIEMQEGFDHVIEMKRPKECHDLYDGGTHERNERNITDLRFRNPSVSMSCLLIAIQKLLHLHNLRFHDYKYSRNEKLICDFIKTTT